MSQRIWPALLATGLVVCSASGATGQVRRFDFTGTAPDPWEQVAPGQAFDSATGFGFEPAADGVSAFSLVVPEGDYRVTVTPVAGEHATVWAETRRLMLVSASTASSFTVNVRRPGLPPPPPNAPGGDRVRLNDRETGSRSWDDRLTLQIDGSVAFLDIAPVEGPRLFLLGDSTVADQAGGDFASWGQMLPSFIDESVAVANHAESGETLKSFLTSLRLDKALSQMRPGDVVLIQFGHNDSKTQWPQTHAGAATTFRSYLRVYIDEIRRRGTLPVLVTSPHRRTFGTDGRIQNSHGDYPDAVRAVAGERNVALIDLTEISARLYEALGPDRSRSAFGDHGRDATHHNLYGASLLASAVAGRLREILPGGGPVRPDVAGLDPDRPPPPSGITLPATADLPANRPAGS
ncbi:MAG: rhamnogalacturonan acetylesterase [Brevundimonas sp.]|uniref:rhamnogalacturonan acetylesterase n=1 Tax=Brevundimonas sp. TaxID=1871086 RepID=UPI002734D5A6|nr:rhamnogalacturonan acetylesterase [Brevundimonas sp.]MDP3406254.1 rhamnogalacturonan acetylesterase [Brevundimonas sp.]